ncbi:hypothetical protein GE09DRAFT_1114077 [Coniochaeta sp. 2T2.1]|nr:hypothetical protein GE09DRAFT_1114077 [Coniochaeta sp. 2T2.1]
MVVTGLHGCTSVVAVSRSGAWLSHFYEVPLFTEQWRLPGDPNEYFDRWVLTALQLGVPGVSTSPYINDTPLGELRDDDATISSPWGHLMDDEEQPKLFVITPREQVKKDDGTFDDSPDAGSDDVLKYPHEVYQIVAKLESMFPNSPVVTKGYNPLDTGDEFENGDGEFNTARGKVMVQYMPAPEAECGDDGMPTSVGTAKYRIWLEDKVIAEEEWEAAPFVQHFDPSIDDGSDASDDTIRPPGPGSDSPRAGSESPPAGGGGSPVQPQRRAACSRRSSSAGTSPTASPSASSGGTTPTASVSPSSTAQSVTAQPSSGPSPSPTSPGGVKCHFDFYRHVRTENQTVFSYPSINHTIYRDDRPGLKYTYNSQWGWNWSLPISFFPEAQIPLPMNVKLEAPVATPSPENYDPATWKVDLNYGSWGFVADYASQGDCVVVDNEEHPEDVGGKRFECKFNCDGSA